MRIEVWNGHRQNFGRLGNPQALVNLPGTVSDPDAVAWIRYCLNDGPPTDFCIGPDQRRLAKPGDFNVELDTSQLIDGKNRLCITAQDTAGRIYEEIVFIHYTAGTSWPLPYQICGAEVQNLQDVAQVVDGRWEIREGRLHCIEPGYDRLVAVGDRLSWKDYEVTVPVTIHSIVPTAMRFPSLGDWAGLVLRWQGRYDWSTDQPLRGWFPLGAICRYFWVHGRQERLLSLLGNNCQPIALDDTGRKRVLGISCWYKARVQSRWGETDWYSFKTWPEGQPEPAEWDVQGPGVPGEHPCGSLLLAAHQCEVSFGDVTIQPL